MTSWVPWKDIRDKGTHIPDSENCRYREKTYWSHQDLRLSLRITSMCSWAHDLTLWPYFAHFTKRGFKNIPISQTCCEDHTSVKHVAKYSIGIHKMLFLTLFPLHKMEIIPFLHTCKNQVRLNNWRSEELTMRKLLWGSCINNRSI